MIEQLEESRISAERLPARVDAERDEFEAAVLESFGEPLKAVVGPS